MPKKGQRGRQPSFSVEDELLITLEYWRKYRTYFHIAQNWQGSKATIFPSFQRVEAILSESLKFHLPGKAVEAGVSVNRGGCDGDSH